MASITLAGSLLDPDGFISIGDQVRFTHKSNTGQTIKSAVSIITIPPSGNYNITLQYGLVKVDYKDMLTNTFTNLGVVTVNQNNPATTLPELLNAAVPPSSQEMIEFQAILADCIAAKDDAEQAVADIDALTGQQTTLGLINSAVAYTVDKVLETSGFTTSGDGGSGSWKQNGVTGQTPSQTPAQLGDALLNDASGNQWGLVHNGTINIGSLGDLSTDCGVISQLAINSGRAKKYILSGNCPFTTTCLITTGDVEINTEAAYIDASGLFGADVKNSPDAVFHVLGSVFGTTSMSADASENDTIITVADGGQLSEGEPIYIKSDGELWYTEAGTQIFVQMINIVKSIAGNVITLLEPLDFDFDATTHTVSVESWSTVKNVTIKHGNSYGGNYRRNLQNGVGIGFVYAQYFNGLDVSGKIIDGFENTAIRAEKGVDFKSHDTTIRGLKSDYETAITEDVNSGFYGVFAVTVKDFSMSNVSGYRVRHLQDAANGTKGIVNNVRGYYCHRPTLGCHSGTHTINYTNIKSIGGAGGLQWRGYDLFINGAYVDCPTQKSSGIYDITGGAGDKPAKRVILGADVTAERNAISIKGKVSELKIESSSLLGGIVGNYHAIDIESTYIEKALISSAVESINGQYNIYFSSSSATNLKVIDIKDSVFNGATNSHVRLNTPAGVAGLRVRGCTFEVGKTFDININNLTNWSVVNENYKDDGTAATINGS